MAQGMKAKSKAKIFNSWEDDGIPGTRASNPGDDCWGMKAKSVGEILNLWEDGGLPSPRAAWTAATVKSSVIMALSPTGLKLYDDGGNMAIHVVDGGGAILTSATIAAAATHGLRITDDGGTLSIFVQDGGNVGIGTKGPQNNLHLHDSGSGANYLQITNADSGSASTDGFAIGIDASESATFWNNENTPIIFATNNANKMRLHAVGGLSIGDSYYATGPGADNVIIEGKLGVGYSTLGTGKLSINGNVGIGTINPDRLLHPEVADAGTAAVAYAVRLSHITSAAATTGFGVGYEIELEDGGGTNRVAAYYETTLTEATATAWAARSAVRMADVAGTYECLRTEASGAAMIGFLGVAAAAKQAHIADVTGSHSTEINAILAALETYGLLATS